MRDVSIGMRALYDGKSERRRHDWLGSLLPMPYGRIEFGRSAERQSPVVIRNRP